MSVLSQVRAKSGAAPRRSVYERRRIRPAYWMIAPAVIYLLVFAFFPLISTADTSFRDVSIVNIVTGERPLVGLSNYPEVLDSAAFGPAARVTLWFAVGSLVLQVPLGLLFALLIHAKVPGYRVGQAILVLGWILPPVTVGAIVRLMVNTDVGVVNSILLSAGIIDRSVSWLSDPATVLPTMIAIHSWSYIPLASLLIYGALKGLPSDIYEAAQVDGARPFATFRHLTLPLLRPVLLTVSLLMVIISFRVFDLIYVLTRGGPNNRTTTLPFHAYREAFSRNDFGQAASISVLTLAMLTVLVVIYVVAARREESY